MNQDSHLVLAGGGHSHALLLRMWAMQPRRRPKGLITLVNRSSTSLYSGMVPGLVAGIYLQEELSFDLHKLSNQAGVALVIAEIIGLDTNHRLLHLADRPALGYDKLSLNVGCITPKSTPSNTIGLGIKPLEPALQRLKQEPARPIHLTGSGLAAIELSLALRHRWPNCPVRLHSKQSRLIKAFQAALKKAGVELRPSSQDQSQKDNQLHLLCTGSDAPEWLAASGLPVDQTGRVFTTASLEVPGHPGLFASGDCAVIREHPRPASGVWAVRSSRPLARNLEACCNGKGLRRWRPQPWALQLVGGFRRNGEGTAWALWGPLIWGPHPWLWLLKTRIDQRFMSRFQTMPRPMDPGNQKKPMLCRGCAAKLPAKSLEAALNSAGFSALAIKPEDAAPLPHAGDSSGQPLLQSVDGFPSLVSDPWLNGRLTALHACSDLWACGARVQSAQSVITVPIATETLQEELLSQTIAGIQSVMEEQGACLLGGHTMEARNTTDTPLSLGMQVALTVQGKGNGKPWPKRGMQAEDRLLLSRPLGIGVLFAAAMTGFCQPKDLDQALDQMSTSQHHLVEQLREMERQHPGDLHAATDITGFGLLGHLGEMLGSQADDQTALSVDLKADAIPALSGALELLEQGQFSSLAPANRRAWALLDGKVKLHLGNISKGSSRHRALLDLLVDPQTCGPLLIAVAPALAQAIQENSTQLWSEIGTTTGS